MYDGLVKKLACLLFWYLKHFLFDLLLRFTT